KSLKVAKSDTDARRLYYITEASRKMGDDDGMMDAVKTLNEKYPDSGWRLKALLAAGNKYLDSNDSAQYEPLFRSASDSFPDDASAANSHWHIAWNAYLADKPEAADLLHSQIERYTSDSRVSSALYFLGRLKEKSGKLSEARACYERVDTQFPHYFYAILARERLSEAKVAAAAADPATAAWLDNLAWPAHRDFSSTEPNTATRVRIDRGRLLMLSGLTDLADAELRFGAKSGDEQPHLLALELARAMPTPFHALRIMKSFIGDYLSIPFDKAPLKFWQMLFPLPYRDDVVRNAKARDLDPYSVAALIRQETEFNPDAHSYANAYGLMQLIPATGRLMGRQVGIRISSTRTLLNPAINIQLGTQYLRMQLNTWNGDWSETLAAYNAGPRHVKEWLTWANYREPAEFVESIPFNQTREYVQAVLRNADMYRTIYGEKHPNMPDVKEASDIPAVNLSALPVAARTPGGGRRTVSASSRQRAHSSAKTTVASKRTPAKTAASAKKATARKSASSKKSAASARKPEPRKKETTESRSRTRAAD
ncbi:MAG: transglycosylase SLT domain-containing protein, partial [Acidobacteriota bacterium]|nr:transglycosylase SLT domain-containing protein [Acidobacteriota bacterium]